MVKSHGHWQFVDHWLYILAVNDFVNRQAAHHGLFEYRDLVSQNCIADKTISVGLYMLFKSFFKIKN